ncbi:Protein transport protein Sec61 subunit beta [Phytophthora pseudosyringae]|uniref:Protein transport protein Sec61 subunit beta n=1 Tax=Phytophthora pseudosyringae TaxID=221518 RepID=A0A8T1VGS9_9STRA|nr:Protein transport protein Sec61 subunit beta [Phytophthora pseudosyringae]
MLLGEMRRAALVSMCMAIIAMDGVVSWSEAATTCPTTAATVSNYVGSTAVAAAQIEYADCTTKVVRIITASDGTTQLDLSSKEIVYVKNIPSVLQLNLKSNNIALLENASIPSTVQMLDLSKNSFTSLQNFAFPRSLVKLTASNGKLASLHNFSFPDSVATLNLSINPIASIGGVVFPSSLNVLSITSTVKLVEFEVRQTDATLFANLQTFNVSMTTSLVCSDSKAMYRYVQDTLLCVLADDVFNTKYGVEGGSSASGSLGAAVATATPELQEASSPRRSSFLLFAAISLLLACVGLMSTLAPRTLYERYQKNKYVNLRKKQQQQQQQQHHHLPPILQPTILQMNELQRDPNITYWDL